MSVTDRDDSHLMKGIRGDLESDEVIWDPEGRWWVGRINRSAGALKGTDTPTAATIMDSTLREGEEVPGTRLGLDAKLRLADAIVEAGFETLEVGYAGVIREHEQLVRHLKASNIAAKLASHTRIYGQEAEWREEIDRNIDSGVDVLTFVGFATEVGTATTPWLNKAEVPERVHNCCSYAKQQGAVVTFGLADLVRTRLDNIVTCYRAAVEAGADTIYVYDGLGAATPEAVAFLTRLLRDLGPAQRIGVHVHDTFGMATACAARAVSEGATVVDAVPLGLGDGAGITASEEIAAALTVLYGVETGIDLIRLKPLCEAVATEFGIEVPATKALVGINQYRHSIDSHVAAILRGAWHSWEVIKPEILGQVRELQFGHSKLRRGRSGALYAQAQQMGYEPSEDEMDQILERVSSLAYDHEYLTQDHVKSVIGSVMAHAATD